MSNGRFVKVKLNPLILESQLTAKLYNNIGIFPVLHPSQKGLAVFHATAPMFRLDSNCSIIKNTAHVIEGAIFARGFSLHNGILIKPGARRPKVGARLVS